MSDDWVPTKLADLEVGDEVRDYGVVTHVEVVGSGVWTLVSRGSFKESMLSHATVDARRLRRPADVTVRPDGNGFLVMIGRYSPAWFGSERHAECYAEKLRSDPTLRAEALGQP